MGEGNLNWSDSLLNGFAGLLIVATALSLLPFQVCNAQGGEFRERLQKRFAQMKEVKEANAALRTKLAGLELAVWEPADAYQHAPLVIFSHGFRGSNSQSAFLMEAFARAGYLVIAPNHKDAMNNGFATAEEDFKDWNKWNDMTYKDRGNDIKTLVAALHKDATWNTKIDWSRVAIAGHSLGGYTALACAGAWPTWKIPEVKAVLALSPYAQPFINNGDLQKLNVPVMYQGGTKDIGITPFVKRPGGAFSKTPAPAYFIDFDNAGHLFWTGLNPDQQKRKLIDNYCLAFLDKYLRDKNSDPGQKLPGVAEVETK